MDSFAQDLPACWDDLIRDSYFPAFDMSMPEEGRVSIEKEPAVDDVSEIFSGMADTILDVHDTTNDDEDYLSSPSDDSNKPHSRGLQMTQDSAFNPVNLPSPASQSNRFSETSPNAVSSPPLSRPSSPVSAWLSDLTSSSGSCWRADGAGLLRTQEYAVGSIALLGLSSRAGGAGELLPMFVAGDELTGWLAFEYPGEGLRKVQATVTLQEFIHTDIGKTKKEVQSSVARMAVGDINISTLESGHVKWPFALPTRGEAVPSGGGWSGRGSGGASGWEGGYLELSVELVHPGANRGSNSTTGSVDIPSLYPPSVLTVPTDIDTDAIERGHSYVLSDEPWKARACPSIMIRGTLTAGSESVVVLAIPVVPAAAVYSGASTRALSFLVTTHSVQLSLKKLVRFASNSSRPPKLTKDRKAYQLGERVGLAQWRVVRAPHELPYNGAARRWRVEMHGEMHPLPGKSFDATFEAGGVSIIYTVNFYTFKAAWFRPEVAQDKELLIAKLDLRPPGPPE
ncbi:hypothetical protein K488DRAFT_83685 [Vararia minispora EC-137]|uniref:Uncharacterized protein n=1 Tax=Vararia minispora EC-137 TaxID=1314806 RepID=A0ACB8QT36_9AGAM|nr:hypothetical protein K488DRAFT_83685 [Vararia minispora EC-137]